MDNYAEAGEIRIYSTDTNKYGELSIALSPYFFTLERDTQEQLLLASVNNYLDFLYETNKEKEEKKRIDNFLILD